MMKHLNNILENNLDIIVGVNGKEYASELRFDINNNYDYWLIYSEDDEEKENGFHLINNKYVKRIGKDQVNYAYACDILGTYNNEKVALINKNDNTVQIKFLESPEKNPLWVDMNNLESIWGELHTLMGLDNQNKQIVKIK